MKILNILSIASLLTVAAACGGGNSGGANAGDGTGGSGGGGAAPPQITIVSPSVVMSDVYVGSVDITGTGFTSTSQVLLDGSPVQTIPGTSTTTEGTLPGGLSLGVHQISVQNGSQVSNRLPYTYYYPAPAPNGLFNAIGGYYAGPESGNTYAVVGDFNGDGRDDVIIQGPGTGTEPTVELLFGQADGTLSPPQYLTNVAGSVAGDIDGNGTVDLVAISMGSSGGVGCSVYLNNGKASFTPGPACPYISAGDAIMWKLVDMNDDGLPDLLVSTLATNGIYLLLNQGGKFANPQLLATPGTNQTFAIADWNDDGRPDIAYNAVGTGGTEEVHFLLNQGNGRFQDTMTTGLLGMTGTLIAADFNVDGVPDLAIEYVPPPGNFELVVSIFLGQGNNAFVSGSETTFYPAPFATYQFVVGDFDHDGFPDLVGQNADGQPSFLLYLWGDGHGNIAPVQIFGPRSFNLEVGDINGDGLPDIVAPDEFNEISVALGQKGRNVPSPVLLGPAIGPYVTTADVNGDGLPDILIGESVFLNQGNESFAAPAFSSPYGFAIADLNHDGLADLVGGTGNEVWVWPGTGDPSFPGSPLSYTPPIQFNFSDLQIFDMDKDGYPDLLSDGLILYSDSEYNFTPLKVPFIGPFVVGDFNGDGYLDIATNAETFLGGPNRTFTQIPNLLGLPDGVYFAVGDFDGDSTLDIATSDGTIWYGDGQGNFYQQGIFTADAPAGGIVVADFNGDGLPDIALGLQTAQQIAVFINNGKGGFERSFYASGAATYGMTSADFNRDGKADLVVCNFVSLVATPNALVIFGK